MRYLRCTLKNASHRINGIAFTDHAEGGVVSAAPLSDDELALFAGISGCRLVEGAPALPQQAPVLIAADAPDRPAPADSQDGASSETEAQTPAKAPKAKK